MVDDSAERCVAHLDVLGMSALVAASFDRAWSMLSDLVSVKDKALTFAYEFVEERKTLPLRDNIGAVVFSDTLVLYTHGTSRVELQSLVILTTEIFHKALFRCVPVRAGISVGEFRADVGRSMYAGPALIEAYEVGEQAQWLGIVLADSLRAQAISLGMKTQSTDVLIPWSVPTKSGPKDCLVVNWPAAFAHDFNVKPPISLEQFYAAFEQSFGHFNDLPLGAQRKYRNTVDFINQQLAAPIAR